MRKQRATETSELGEVAPRDPDNLKYSGFFPYIQTTCDNSPFYFVCIELVAFEFCLCSPWKTTLHA